MKKKLKGSLTAIALCAALIVSGVPAYPAITAKADSGSTEKKPLIEAVFKRSGSTDPDIIELKVNTQNLSDLQNLTYNWYLGDNESSLSSVGNNTDTYELPHGTNSKENACIQVMVTDGAAKKYKSDIYKISGYEMKVDFISGVTVKSGSDNKKVIAGTTGDMWIFKGTKPMSGASTSGGSDFPVENGESYCVGYKNTVLDKTSLKGGLYAVYEIEKDAAPTSSPDPTSGTTATPRPQTPTSPSFSPVIPPTPNNTPGAPATSAPDTPTPAVTAEPSSLPATPAVQTPVPPTQKPQITPAPTPDVVIPTPTPEQTGEPKMTPTPPEKPTVTSAPPDAEENEEKANIDRAGTKVTVGAAEYESIGAGTVTYVGTKTASEKKVAVPSAIEVNGKSYPVTKVGDRVFAGSKVESVTLGANVKNLGTASFKNCKNLKKIKFSSKLKGIGDGAFHGCTKLSSATLPTSVKKIGDRAFKNCKSLKKFTIGKKPVKTKKGNIMFGGTANKITIGANALENCMKLRQVIINSQVTKIGNATFKNCKKLASIMVRSLMLQKVGGKALVGVNNCKISVPTIRLKKYRTLFKNKGQGKKVVIAKV